MLEDAKKKLSETELTRYFYQVLTMLNDFELIIYSLIGTGIFAFGSGDLRGFLKAVAKARSTLTQVSKESTQLLLKQRYQRPNQAMKSQGQTPKQHQSQATRTSCF